MVSQAELILRVITLLFLVLSQFFRDGMGPFKYRLYTTTSTLQICDVANKFKTLINLVVFVQYLSGNTIKARYIISFYMSES